MEERREERSEWSSQSKEQPTNFDHDQSGFAVTDGKRQAQHFCSSSGGGAHCVFTLERVLTLR